jgi:hypothetical protein
MPSLEKLPSEKNPALENYMKLVFGRATKMVEKRAEELLKKPPEKPPEKPAEKPPGKLA